MFRFIAAATFVLLAPAPAAAQERTIPIADFERIVVEGPFSVRLVRGNVTRAAVSGPRASVEGVSVEMQGQTLRVRRNPNHWGTARAERAGAAQVILSTRTLRSARVIGGGRLGIQGFQAQRLDLALEGSGAIDATGLEVDQLSAALRGAGNISLAGRAARLNADVQGSGGFDGRALQVENANVATATSGSVTLTAVRTANVTASGVGEVEVAGTAACTIRGRSAASVVCGPAR